MGEKPRTLRDGNGRIARLARWLTQLPANAEYDHLVLEQKDGGDWTRLQIWPRDYVSQSLADSIDSAVQDLANELGQFVQARCAWWSSEKERYWTEHQLRCAPEDMEGFQAFAGDQTSAIIQTQRHLEVMARTHVGGFQAAIRAIEGANQSLQAIAKQAQSENLRLRERVAELEAENVRLTSLAEQAAAAAEAAQAATDTNDPTHVVVDIVKQAVGMHMMNGKGQQPAQG